MEAPGHTARIPNLIGLPLGPPLSAGRLKQCELLLANSASSLGYMGWCKESCCVPGARQKLAGNAENNTLGPGRLEPAGGDGVHVCADMYVNMCRH